MQITSHKLYPYKLKELPRRWQLSSEAPIFVLGSARFQTSNQIAAFIVGVIFCLFAMLFLAAIFWPWLQNGEVQVELNEELITLGWQQAKATALVLGFISIFLILGLAALSYAFRLRRTPHLLAWLTEEGLLLQRDDEKMKYHWSHFQNDRLEFRPDGTAVLPLKENKGVVMIGRISSPRIFFQLLDRHISGNTDLIYYHQFEEQIKSTDSKWHPLRRFGSLSLQLLKTLTIGLGLLLFASIPFIFVTVVHLKDDGDLIFQLFEYAALGVVVVFMLAALWSSIKSFFIEYKSPDPGSLWQILSFRQNVGVLIFAGVFFAYYFWLAEQSFDEAIFFENLFYFFYAIPVFFVCLLVFYFIANRIRKYLLPVLALREFGAKGIAGQWSPALAPGENELKVHDDNFLHNIGGLFSIKPVYAYYDRRLDPEGFQDEKVAFFLQSTAWLDYVTSCAKIAQAVIIVPATSESLLMEMNMLRNEGLLHKTYVLMPPENREGQTIQTQWEKIRATIQTKGYHLPSYEAGGMVYIPRKDYSVDQRWKLHHSMQNLFFIPELRRWRLSRYSVHDQIYASAAQLKSERTETQA